MKKPVFEKPENGFALSFAEERLVYRVTPGPERAVSLPSRSAEGGVFEIAPHPDIKEHLRQNLFSQIPDNN